MGNKSLLTERKTGFHIHTYYSSDSIMKPGDIVDICAGMGYETIIITDHNEIKGAEQAREYSIEKYNGKIEVIIGEEVKTDIGDIIGFPLSKRIEKGAFEDVVKEMKRQNAYICIPHPYLEHNLQKIHNDEILKSIDFVEVLNCRVLNGKLNEYAGEYSIKYGIKRIIGSDAHLESELGNSFFIWDNDFEIRSSGYKLSTRRKIRASAIIKAVKSGKYIKIIPLIIYYIIGK